MKVDEARAMKCLPFNYMGDEAGMSCFRVWPLLAQGTRNDYKVLGGSDSIAGLAESESVPGLMDKLEQFFAKYYLKEEDSKEGMIRVLKEPALPTDDDEFLSSFFGDMLIAMKEAESE
eukprot:scaffold8652_cov125-Skeletonema_dohrnii-CCMP3373.AAC.2